MVSEISPELKEFIVDFFKQYKHKRFIDAEEMTFETSIDFDLGLYDLDIDLFLGVFVEKFNIDYTEFDWKNHGGYPGFLPLKYWYYKIFFNNKTESVKRKLKETYVPKLKIADLQNALLNGKLR